MRKWFVIFVLTLLRGCSTLTSKQQLSSANIDSVTGAINRKSMEVFRSGFHSLTDACNNCHRAINFECNVIIIPTAPPVTNQDFKAQY